MRLHDAVGKLPAPLLKALIGAGSPINSRDRHDPKGLGPLLVHKASGRLGRQACWQAIEMWVIGALA